LFLVSSAQLSEREREKYSRVGFGRHLCGRDERVVVRASPHADFAIIAAGGEDGAYVYIYIYIRWV
jgi:hypothetical protein